MYLNFTLLLKGFSFRRLTVTLGWALTDGFVVLRTGLDQRSHFIPIHPSQVVQVHAHLPHNSLSQILIEHFLFTPCHHVPLTRKVTCWKEIIHFLRNNSEPHGVGPEAGCFPFHWFLLVCHLWSLRRSQAARDALQPCSGGANPPSG